MAIGIDDLDDEDVLVTEQEPNVVNNISSSI